MHSTRMALVIGGALCVATSVAGAQRRDDIPPYMLPSAGMCRVWVDGLPVQRQQPQTDCDTARRNLPRNARIIWGSQQNGSQSDPRHTQTASNGNYDSRNDRWSLSERERAQRARVERERIERERKREAWERARLARERREREEERRREAWKRSHHDKKDHDRDKNDRDHDKNDRDDRRRDGQNDDNRGGGWGAITSDARKNGTRP